MKTVNFAFYYAVDGYSTDRKIMGRQSAGKALMNGAARWGQPTLHGYGPNGSSAQAMLKQLRGDGYLGELRWHPSPAGKPIEDLGAIYYPAPVSQAMAHARNLRDRTAYSLFGVTHTLSSAGAMDQLTHMVMPPFQPWDALICTSSAALSVATRLQDDYKAWLSEHTGATRFNDIAMPVIPLGVDVPAFVRQDDEVAAARAKLGLAEDEVAFLFAGRLSFHAKANPAAFYIALEAAIARTGRRLVCIEAGVFPNTSSQDAFQAAARQLAPSARFLLVDGGNEALYRAAWRAADVFVSLSDNIQETFGLTPLEAMAAGLPVLASDWNGYKDHVRDGVDGFRIPVILPPDGSGPDLAARHAVGLDSYDYYIGRVAIATAVDIEVLTDRMVKLAESPDLRRSMGAAGQAHATAHYDWPTILDHYVDLVETLGEKRRAAGPIGPDRWPARPDPFALFGDYPTRTVAGDWKVVAQAARRADVEAMTELGVARYAIDPKMMSRETLLALHHAAAAGQHTVDSLLARVGGSTPGRMRGLMWLAKLGLVTLVP